MTALDDERSLDPDIPAAARTGGPGVAEPFLPSPSLPKGGGAIHGMGEKFTVNPARGIAALAVPLGLSPGRSGATPALVLGYSSGSGNSPFGLGFDVRVPVVARRTSQGVPRYDDTDAYLLSEAEDLVPALIGQPDGTWTADVRTTTIDGAAHRVQRFRPRVDTVFTRVERCEALDTGNVFWRTVSRANVTSVFGRTPSGRVADPADPRRVFQWLLEEVRDDRGNVTTYEYKAEDTTGVSPAALHEQHRLDGPPPARRYLKRIRYGNRVPGESDPACLLVVFDYGEHDRSPTEARPWPVREDPFSDCRAGFEVRTWRLCRRVLMFHDFPEEFIDGPNPRLVASTDLTYAPDQVTTKLTSVTRTGYDWDAALGDYRFASLPPLELTYTTAAPDTEPRLVESVPVPEGDGPYWLDLDGEGVPGALRRYAGAWWYQRNMGGGRIGAPEQVTAVPSPAAAGPGGTSRLRLADLAGDGRLCLVDHGPGGLGSAQREPGSGWSPFRPFRDNAVLDLDDPALRQVDLDGNGLPDLLFGAGDGLMWHRGAGREGWGPRRTVTLPGDEERGPRLTAVDATRSVFTADLSGDGLADLVRIGNGEVCYWPALGHGRFGPKVTMDAAPVFDHADTFDPRRVRLADLDGSGPADLLYLGRDGVYWWRNLAGNGFGPRQRIDPFPRVDGLGRADVVDLLGTGTSCLVWSSPLDHGTVLYLDLSRGTDTGLPDGDARLAGWKPHLLRGVRNNLGAETRIEYAPSTRFYLADRDSADPAGRWVTTLPFPVQVVASSRVTDAVSGADHVCRYAYRHGLFDGTEREFRGFGMVESQDTETFTKTPVGELDLPPVRTRSWFHTGGYEDVRTGTYTADPLAVSLPPPQFDGVSSGQEHRQALRALTGAPLRSEIYSDDGTPQAAHPYSVTEHRYRVALLQPAAEPTEQGRPAPVPPWAAWAAFTSHEAESVSYHYERNPADPRVSHALTLEVDDYGSVLSSAAIGYGRRTPGVPEQRPAGVTWTKTTVVNTDTPGVLRLGTPVEVSSFEITGLADPGSGRHSLEYLRDSFAGSVEIPYEATPAPDGVRRRCVERQRTRYWSDALDAALPLGQVGSRALPHQVHRLAFTAGLLTAAYGTLVDAALLTTEGGYVFEDGLWWAPSAVTGYDPDAFYLAVASTTPFGNTSTVRYDRYLLLPTVTTASQTAPYAALATTADYDYRLLTPRQVTDPNGNRARAAFSPLGLVTATWSQGRASGEGDPDALPGIVYTYGLDAWRTTGSPAWVHIEMREQHGDPSGPRQRSRVYTDGLGRVAMTKSQAEPGLAWALDADGQPVQVDTSPNPRWIGSGRTVYNNKALPVEQYEPYFSTTVDFEHADALVKQGVTPILRYDPLGRLIRTDHPDGTFEQSEFDPWQEIRSDPGDTVLASRWYSERQTPGTPPAEQRGAALAAAYANTPSVAVLDTLGRPVRTLEDNGPDGVHETVSQFDIQGNTLNVTDPRGLRTLTQTHDMLGRVVRTNGADTGERTQLADSAGVLLRSWDVLGTTVRFGYDLLRRPTETWVRAPGSTTDRLADLTVYGETHPQALNGNLLGQVYRHYDDAGLEQANQFDFKGNLLSSTRTLPTGDGPPDWSPLYGQPLAALDALAASKLDGAEVFTTSTQFDALNREVARTLPDGTQVKPRYGEGGLLDSVTAQSGSAPSATAFVTAIDHDAKRRRQKVRYIGDTVTTYTYDPLTSNLRGLFTVGGSGAVLQDLTYTYDAVGNIVEVGDRAQQTTFFSGAVAAPVTQYTYDLLYRLQSASGREHASLGVQPDSAEPLYAPLPHPNDAQALRPYRQTYTYDRAGNLLELAHSAGPTGSFTRRCTYDSASNRLLSHTRPGDLPGSPGSATFTHDANGRMTAMAHLPGALEWNYAGELQTVDLGGGGKAAYAYDAGGRRVRKTVTRQGGLQEERIYLGEYEVFRRRLGQVIVFERTTLHVGDDQGTFALVETVTVDQDHPAFDPSPVVRLQLGNHLGSVLVEVTETGQVISYEEYHPFGTTSLWLAAGTAQVSVKRYRYTGKEKDEETALYYYGARTYACWLARWTSPDPDGFSDGLNLYAYVDNDPVGFGDPVGTAKKTPRSKKPKADLRRRTSDPVPESAPRKPRLPFGADDWKTPRHIRGWNRNQLRRHGPNTSKWTDPPGFEGGHKWNMPHQTHGDVGGVEWELRADNEAKRQIFERYKKEGIPLSKKPVEPLPLPEPHPVAPVKQTEHLIEKSAEKLITGHAGEQVGESLLKKIGTVAAEKGSKLLPGVGMAIAVGQGVEDLREGDYIGAVLDFGSAIPGPIGEAFGIAGILYSIGKVVAESIAEPPPAAPAPAPVPAPALPEPEVMPPPAVPVPHPAPTRVPRPQNKPIVTPAEPVPQPQPDLDPRLVS
jgi:RHS repeat-associated core domain